MRVVCRNLGSKVYTGRASADGTCVGSKKSLQAALKRRKILYEPLLVEVPEVVANTSPYSQSRANSDPATSRRGLLQWSGAAAVLSLANSQPAKVNITPASHILRLQELKLP